MSSMNDDLPPAVPAMWRALKRGFEAEPTLLSIAFVLSLIAALPDESNTRDIGSPARLLGSIVSDCHSVPSHLASSNDANSLYVLKLHIHAWLLCEVRPSLAILPNTRGRFGSRKISELFQTFNHQCLGFASTNTQTGNAKLATSGFQSMYQSRDDSSTSGPNGMTQSHCTAVHIHFFRIKA